MTPLILIGLAALALIAVNVLCLPETPEDDHERRFKKYWKDEER